MAVKVRCSSCQKVLTVPDAARGKAVKCPGCDAKVPVPAGEATSTSAAPKKSKSAAKPDSESALATLDLRNVEDRDARICPKCGYDMSAYDEETTDCPKCGTNTVTGGLGEKARKKLLKGPDPDKFYESLWKQNWRFVWANQLLAWRTMAYLLIASTLMFLCLFLYLYIPMWPPRIFFAGCTIVCGMVIPGWLWFLSMQMIAGTLQRKDKLKRINFDFFLSSALGIKFVGWHIIFAIPLMILPIAFCMMLSQFAGVPKFVAGIVAAISYIPVLAMMPIALGHMTMPVENPAWMFWKVVPCWIKVLKPTLLWVLLFIGTNLPAIGCLAVAGVFSGNALVTMVQTMESNAELSRLKRAAENAPKKKAVEAAAAPDPRLAQDFAPVAYSAVALPYGMWVLAILFSAFPLLYLMRLNGQIIYYFRDSLDLIALAKEYKYVAKQKVDEDEEMKPKTLSQAIINGVALMMVFSVIGTVFGYVMESLKANPDVPAGLLAGLLWGMRLAFFTGMSMIGKVAWDVGIGWGILIYAVPSTFVIAVICGFLAALVPVLFYVAGGICGVAVVLLALAAYFVATNWDWTKEGAVLAGMAFSSQILVIVLAVVGILAWGSALGVPVGGEDGAAAGPPAGQMVPGEMPDGEAPGMPAGAPGMPAGAPGMPAGAPGMPAGAPGMPAGAPGMPAGAPGMPAGAPGAIPPAAPAAP
jgi:DNA-directed RNA polymerase subunit M/transcription elongation factor TFIIS